MEQLNHRFLRKYRIYKQQPKKLLTSAEEEDGWRMGYVSTCPAKNQIYNKLHMFAEQSRHY